MTRNISDETERDLLIRIDANVKTMQEQLRHGTTIMEDHEKRIKEREVAAMGFVTLTACAASHRAMTRNFIVLLISVITALISIVVTLLKQ